MIGGDNETGVHCEADSARVVGGESPERYKSRIQSQRLEKRGRRGVARDNEEIIKP